jgi:hypothetical protein
MHVRFAPKADIIWFHSRRQLLANAAIAASYRAGYDFSRNA